MLFIRWLREAGSEAGAPSMYHGCVYMSRCKQSRFTPAWNWSPCESEQLQELSSYYCHDQAGCTRSASMGGVIPCFLSFGLANWVCTSAQLFTAVLVYPYHAAVFHLSGSWRKEAQGHESHSSWRLPAELSAALFIWMYHRWIKVRRKCKWCYSCA